VRQSTAKTEGSESPAGNKIATAMAHIARQNPQHRVYTPENLRGNRICPGEACPKRRCQSQQNISATLKGTRKARPLLRVPHNLSYHMHHITQQASKQTLHTSQHLYIETMSARHGQG